MGFGSESGDRALLLLKTELSPPALALPARGEKGASEMSDKGRLWGENPTTEPERLPLPLLPLPQLLPPGASFCSRCSGVGNAAAVVAECLGEARPSWW